MINFRKLCIHFQTFLNIEVTQTIDISWKFSWKTDTTLLCIFDNKKGWLFTLRTSWRCMDMYLYFTSIVGSCIHDIFSHGSQLTHNTKIRQGMSYLTSRDASCLGRILGASGDIFSHGSQLTHNTKIRQGMSYLTSRDASCLGRILGASGDIFSHESQLTHNTKIRQGMSYLTSRDASCLGNISNRDMDLLCTVYLDPSGPFY